MIPQLQAGLIRILTPDGDLAGVGFLISPRRILCAASSVLALLGQPADPERILYEEILVHFDEYLTYTGRVVGWHPGGLHDVFDAAILELAANAVIDANPLRLSVIEDPIGHPFKTLGFGTEKGETVLAVGRFVSLDSDGFLQVEELEPGDSFRLPGFLGAPVWDDRAQSVVGMLTLLESSQGVVPGVVPFNTLIKFFPDIPIRLPTENPGQLIDVPDLPPHFVMRSTEFRRLRAALLAGRQQRSRRTSLSGTTGSMGITTTGPADSLRSERIVLQGHPGIGKTTLAAAVVRDDYLRHMYPDGIFWLHLGLAPDLTLVQANLARLAGATYGAYADPRQGRRMLRGLLANRACLVVLDDVWDVSYAASFDCLGPKGMLLVIGPEIGLAGSLRARRVQLGPMVKEEAERLICAWAEVQPADYHSEIPPILSACDYNPLAISLAGVSLDNDSAKWSSFVEHLSRQDISVSLSKMGYFSYQKIVTVLTSVVLGLPEDARKLFFELAIFPSGEPVPVSALHKLWKVHNLDSETLHDTILLLIRRNLLQKHEDPHGGFEVILHDFVSMFIRTHWENLTPLYQQLLKSYGLLNQLNDHWLLDNVTNYLRLAGQFEDLKQLLFSYTYLLNRLVSSGVDGLLHDYTLALATSPLSIWDRGKGSQELTLIRNALRTSAPIISAEYKELPGQIIARLGGYELPGIQKLIESAKGKQGFAWLFPLASSLNHPGSKRLLSLAGHHGRINSLLISLDGRLIISAGVDRAIRIWDLDSGHLVRTLRGHDGSISDLALAPDGLRLISGSYDGTIKIWQLSDGICLETLPAQSERVLKISPTHDGRRLLAACSDHKIYVWNLENSTVVGTYQLHDDWIQALVVLPGSLQAVSASREIKVWDIETGQVMYTLTGHQDKINDLAITQDGQKLLSISDDQNLFIWDLQTGRELRSMYSQGEKLTGLALMPGIHMAVTISRENILRTWNIDSGRLVDQQDIPGGRFSAIAISPAGRKLVTAGDDGNISVWDWTNRRRLRVMRGHSSRVNSAILLPDGQRVISGSSDGSLRTWELASGQELYSLQVRGPGINVLAVTQDGRRLFSGSDDGQITIWDLFNEFSPLVINGHSGPVLGLAITPDGRRLISTSADATVSVWNIERSPGYPLGQGLLQSILYGHTSWVRGVAALPDNWRAVTVSADRTLKLWDLDTAQVIYSLDFFQGELNDVAVLMNGLRVVTAGDDQIVRVLDLRTGHPQFRLIGHSGEVNAVAATPDGKRVISVSHDRTVRVWDIPNKRRTRRGGRDDLEGLILQNSLVLEDHTDWIQTVAITNDGRRAISASDDATLRQWDISQDGDVSLGTKPCLPPGHSGSVLSLSFSADGRYILSSGTDYSTRIWMVNRSPDNGLGRILEKFPGRIFPVSAEFVCFFHDGVHFCSASRDQTIQIWDIDQPDTPLRVLSGITGAISHLACSTDGRKISAIESNKIKIWDVVSGQLTTEYDFPDQKILAMEFMPDRRRVSALNSSGKLFVLDALLGNVFREVNLGLRNKPVNLAVAKFNPSSMKIAGFTTSGDLAIWDVNNAYSQTVGRSNTNIILPQPPESIQCLAFANRGHSLGIASGQEFMVYDLSKTQRTAQFHADADILTCVASAHNDFFVAGDRIGRIHFLVLEDE